MSPLVLARTHTAGAVTAALGAATALHAHPTLAIAALAAAFVCAGFAAGYRHDARRDGQAAEHAARQAVAIPDPLPMPEWGHIAQQADYNDLFDEIIRHYNQEQQP